MFSIFLASLFIVPIVLYRPNGFSSSSFSQSGGDEYIWENYGVTLLFDSNGNAYYAWQGMGGMKITISVINRTMINSVLYDTLWGFTAQNTAYNRTWQNFSSYVTLIDTYNGTFGCCSHSFCGSLYFFIPHNETAANTFLYDLLNGLFGNYNWTSGPHGYDGLITLTSGSQRIEIQYNENGVMHTWKYFENEVLQSETKLISNEFPIWKKSILLTTLLWLGIIGILITTISMIITLFPDSFRAINNRFFGSRLFKSKSNDWNISSRISLWCFGIVFIFIIYLYFHKYPHELGHAILGNIFGFQSKIFINLGEFNAYTTLPLMLYASTTQLICVTAAGSCSSLVVAVMIKFGFGRLKYVQLLCSFIAIGLLLDPLLYPLTNMNTPEGYGDWYVIVHIYNSLWLAIVVIFAASVLIFYTIYGMVIYERNLKKKMLR